MMRLAAPVSRLLASSSAIPACLVAALLVPAVAGAQVADRPAADAPPLMTLDDVHRGQLLFHAVEPGRYAPAPLVATEVEMAVSGIVARTIVRQHFVNPTREWLEGRYVFPLPENAAVNRMKLVVGDRVVEAKIAERQAARAQYEQAKREGRRAALVEQHRPNIFSNAVANIPPGGRIAVELQYFQRLRYDQGKFSLRFPMVVAPRFDPAAAAQHLVVLRPAPVPGAPGGDEVAPPSIPPSVSGETPIAIPVRDTEKDGALNPVTIRIDLDAGMTLAEIASPHHEVTIETLGTGRRRIALSNRTAPADRDFVLSWTPKLGAAPTVAAFRETSDGATYVLALVMPPDADAASDAPRTVPPRDAVFILDRSGSMGGTSIRAARAALAEALARLKPGDRFNLIRFSNQTDWLFETEQPATDVNKMIADSYLKGTEANGGTVMRPALLKALATDATPGRLRQVVFLTDGAVANEIQLFREIRLRLGNTRLFTVGIGSAPNSYFMRKAAEAGRGSHVYIGRIEQVAPRMAALFDKLERPAVAGVGYAWSLGNGSAGAETYPAVVPDLYFGEPVVVIARIAGEELAPHARLDLAAGTGTARWTRTVALGDARSAVGIGTVWARSKIAALNDSLAEGAPPQAVKEAVTRVALAHGLVSRYTSLIATERSKARPDGMPLASGDVPLNLPHGWDMQKTLGAASARGAGFLHGRASLLRKSAVQAAPRADAAAAPVAMEAVVLPKGATPFALHFLAGIATLIAATALAVFLRLRSGAGSGGRRDGADCS